MSITLTREIMKINGRYNWKGQPDRLIYLGKKGSWHQFKKIGDPRPVWCEVLDEDLHMMEETAPNEATSDSAVRDGTNRTTNGTIGQP